MPEVTYGRLDEVLRDLGFAAHRMHIDVEARVYKHPSGALIALPAFPDSRELLPRHLLAVEMQLDAFGISQPADFRTRLQKAG